ncbi:MAG: hypothetical protein CM1200mP30_12640 [Pseudomonadota bacterium]|nr:MAG: hypothetical protein CM1200mP30_12640 [Pseudomonadota bacterium]
MRAFSWDDLWLRPDQQATELFYQGETDYASKLFEDNEWKATAAYRSGDFEKALNSSPNRTILVPISIEECSGICRTSAGCN